MSAAPTNNYGQKLGPRLAPSIERFKALARMISQSTRVALPAVVKAFYPGPPATVSVVIATLEFVEANEGGDVVSMKTTPRQLPQLDDVPILIPTAGGWSATFPIQVGDECLVVFSDTTLDAWLQSGGENNQPVSQRRHSLSDGIAIFGLRSSPRAITGYSVNSMQLRNDAQDVVINLEDGKITITAPIVTVQADSANVNATAVNVTGTNVTIGSATKIDGRVFLTHTHNNVQPGSGTTGVVT